MSGPGPDSPGGGPPIRLWVCRRCGSANDPSFAGCWNCGAALDDTPGPPPPPPTHAGFLEDVLGMSPPARPVRPGDPPETEPNPYEAPRAKLFPEAGLEPGPSRTREAVVLLLVHLFVMIACPPIGLLVAMVSGPTLLVAERWRGQPRGCLFALGVAFTLVGLVAVAGVVALYIECSRNGQL
jgi:hypothetical protein